MKSPGGFASASIIAISAFLLSCQSPTVTENGQAVVVRVKGEARFCTNDQTWIKLKKGMGIGPGVVIQTAPKSLVDLDLSEGRPKYPANGSEATGGHIIRIFENSALKLNVFTRNGAGSKLSEDIRMDLKAGQMMGRIENLNPGSSYEIKITHGMVHVRGGIYMVSSIGVVNVMEGSDMIEITNRDGSVLTKEIRKLESFDPETGKITTLPLNPEGPTQFVGPTNSDNSQPLIRAPGLPHGSGMGDSLRKF